MQIAILLIGHIRNYEIGLEKFRNNLIQPLLNFKRERESNTIDIFIDIWDKRCSNATSRMIYNESHRRKKWHEEQVNVNKLIEDYQPIRINIDNENIVKLNDSLKTKFICGRSIDNHAEAEHIHKDDRFHYVGQYYKLWKCNESKKEYEKQCKFKYDCVIKWRFDFNIITPLNLQVLNNLNYIYTSHQQSNAVSDFIFISSSENMDKLTNIYPNLPNIWNKHFGLGPEKTLYFHVKENNLEIKGLDEFGNQIERNEWDILGY